MITTLKALTEMRQELYSQPVGAVSHAFGVEITKNADGVTLRAAVLPGSPAATVVVERRLLDVTVEILMEAIQKILAEAMFGPYLKMLQPGPLTQPAKTMPWANPPWTNPIIPGNPYEFPKWVPAYPGTIPPVNPIFPMTPWVSPMNPGPMYMGDPPVPPFTIVCEGIQGIGKLGGTATDGLTAHNDPNGDPT